MKQLLNSDMEIIVASDFIYMPLLFDPDVEDEIRTMFQPEECQEKSTSQQPNTIICRNGRYFVKGLDIHSLLENFKKLDAYDYERIRNDCLNEYHLLNGTGNIFFDETLDLILFQVMPYFIRKNKVLQRKKLDREGVLDLVVEKIDTPEKYLQKAKTLCDLRSLRDLVKYLDSQSPMFKPLENGLIASHQLQNWLHEAVRAKILGSERDRISKALHVRQQFGKVKPEHIAALLYIAESGALEIDGFGFIKSNTYNEYLVYKRTGEYTLKDYYARSYLFPDCRVAISTYTPFWPFVIEKYKHPFLLRHKSGQEICMKDFRPPEKLTAQNIINVLEEGLTALCYGYDGRRRNGYHSLDKRWVHIPAIDFEDYRV